MSDQNKKDQQGSTSGGAGATDKRPRPNETRPRSPSRGRTITRNPPPPARQYSTTQSPIGSKSPPARPARKERGSSTYSHVSATANGNREGSKSGGSSRSASGSGSNKEAGSKQGATGGAAGGQTGQAKTN